MRSEIEALAVRMASLERTNRWLKGIVVAIVMVLVALTSMGLSAKSRTIEAERFVILDAHGRTRLTMGMHEVEGAAIGMEPALPAVWLTDEKGSDRAILTSDGLYFTDGREKTVVNLSNGSRGPGLQFYRPDGRLFWSAP